MDNGELIPEEMILSNLLKKLTHPKIGHGEGIIVDGYPRTKTQVVILINIK